MTTVESQGYYMYVTPLPCTSHLRHARKTTAMHVKTPLCTSHHRHARHTPIMHVTPLPSCMSNSHLACYTPTTAMHVTTPQPGTPHIQRE
ncbi:hypothetical protein Pmani_034472 [Petrolisthes manimaculis]|uniref:Uncharacterized protein n=1 Tax=Petrolisthes manimaculis TaxID=1843537 RepID=A0AAE1NP99_9EUCA|nr:hypothetical protein Pmani_034472 [Petrolisthes manimaculis]